jgi:hypothetical protein
VISKTFCYFHLLTSTALTGPVSIATDFQAIYSVPDTLTDLVRVRVYKKMFPGAFSAPKATQLNGHS